MARANRTPSLSGPLAHGRQSVSKPESHRPGSHAVACLKPLPQAACWLAITPSGFGKIGLLQMRMN
ncbi:hypothetical protein BM1_07744 [Bipolaris maydis]|nr:hypothetical protein BM1_07744 [Bipolaris maydis]